MVRLGGLTILATVCNTTPEMAPYALWLAKDDQEYLVDLSDLLRPEKDIGLTGLAYHDGSLYLAVQSGSSPRILVFDRQLTCIDVITHRNITDIHSLYFDDGKLLVVSTGNQSVIAIDPTDHGATTLFSTGQRIHVNSVVRDERGLLICCQSPKHLFGSASQGGVIDVTNQRIILDGLGYPHSLEPDGEQFIVLDSTGERVIRFDHNGIVQQQAVSGFLRGASALAGCLYVASSVGRITSRKHPQPPSRPPGWEALGERVCIHELDGKTLTARGCFFPLVAGFEIYELLVLAGADVIDPPAWRMLTPDPHTLSRAFYEAAKSAVAGRRE